MHALLATTQLQGPHHVQQQPQTYNPNSIRPRSPVANQAEPPCNHELLLLINLKSMGLQHPQKAFFMKNNFLGLLYKNSCVEALDHSQWLSELLFSTTFSVEACENVV